MFKKVPSLTINALMMVLLLAMLALPISGLSLSGYMQVDPSASEVLSAQDCNPQPSGDEEEFLEAEREYYRRLIEQAEAERAIQESEAARESAEPAETELEEEEETSEEANNQE